MGFGEAFPKYRQHKKHCLGLSMNVFGACFFFLPHAPHPIPNALISKMYSSMAIAFAVRYMFFAALRASKTRVDPNRLASMGKNPHKIHIPNTDTLNPTHNSPIKKV
jgi:hypothetical protein